jgi:uncharacterized protein
MRPLYTFLLIAFFFPSRLVAENYWTGIEAYNTGNYFKAVAIWTPLAESGSSWAQASLGEMHQQGKGVPQNYEVAAFWYKAAAEQGLDIAQINLAKLYEDGLGIDQDYAEAFRWYLTAARQGAFFAHAKLGEAYLMGRGVPQSDVMAHMWLNIASTAGNESAQMQKDMIEARLSEQELAQAQRLATACWESGFQDC